MNTSILQKCVDELKKDKPNLQYVLGIIETLIDMAPNPQSYSGIHSTNLTPPSQTIYADEKREIPESMPPAAVRSGPVAGLRNA